MTPSQVADLLGTLATAGVLTLVLVAVILVVRGQALATLRSVMWGNGPLLGSIFAIVATLGSLWFSEGAHFPPCRLCWFQRIAMYPLAVLLPIAAIRRDRGIRLYGLVLAGLGLVVNAYHVLIELYPNLESGSCDPTNPCSLRWVEGLGFWTIPRMASVAFLLVAGSLFLDRSGVGAQASPR